MAFGSTNPADHPELASIVMEIAAGLERCFVGAHVRCGFLRANMQRRFWNKILQCQRNNIDRNIRILHMFGVCPTFPWGSKFFIVKVIPPCKILHEAQTSAKARGKLQVLVLKSRIPPYHSYSVMCEIGVPQDTTTKKKQPRSCLDIWTFPRCSTHWLFSSFRSKVKCEWWHANMPRVIKSICFLHWSLFHIFYQLNCKLCPYNRLCCCFCKM